AETFRAIGVCCSTDSLIWEDLPGATTPIYSRPAIVTPGKYFYRLAIAAGGNISLTSCRIASEVVMINVHDLPVPMASNSGPGCEGVSLTFTATGGGNYLWNGPGNFTSNTQSPIITNPLAGNSGMYYVKVTSEYGCINNDSTSVVINLNPRVGAGSDADICEGATTALQGSGVNAMSYTWSPATGLSNSSISNPSASPAETTLYILTVSNGVCQASDSVLVNVSKKPFANAGPDKAFIEGQFVTLSGEASGTNISYFWTPNLYLSSDAVLNPQVSPPYDTTYTLHVISNNGCGEATDKVLLRYFKDIYIPNAFTPNNDGLNDSWNVPVLPAFPLAEVSVYNRYGQLVFFNKGYTKQWDGTFKGIPQSSGVYCYVVDLKNGYKKLSGIVVLIR
ncbi:MAG: gliding motility-associated C-terminal domain-containing protein, partial [Ginsengibacter sp.]